MRFKDTVIADFRANAGKVGGNFEGAPMLLLHTVGAKSGKPRQIQQDRFADYERKTERTIPVLLLTRRGAPQSGAD